MSQKVAIISKASAPVVVEREGKTLELGQGDAAFESDIIKTQKTSVELTFEDGSIVMLSPLSVMNIKDFSFGHGENPSMVMQLTQGLMRSITGEVVEQNPDAFKVLTPKATVGIRGTDFLVKVNEVTSEEFTGISIGQNHNLVITTHEGLQLSLTSPHVGAFLGAGASDTLTPRTLTPQEVDDIVQTIVKTLSVSVDSDEQEDVKAQTEDDDQSSGSHGLTNVLFDAESLGELNAQTLAKALVEELELLEVEVPLIGQSSETEEKLEEVLVGEASTQDSADDSSSSEQAPEQVLPPATPPVITFSETSGTVDDGNIAFTEGGNPTPVSILATSSTGSSIADVNSYEASLTDLSQKFGVGNSIAGTYGSLELVDNGGVEYRYTLGPSDTLKPGETVTDNFYVHVTDNGLTTSQQVSVSVTGDGTYSFTGTAATDSLSFTGVLNSGTIALGDGFNTLSVGGLSSAAASITGGQDVDSITVTGNMSEGDIYTYNGNDNITINGTLSGGALWTQGGTNTITIGSMTGGTIYTSSGTVNIDVGMSSNDTIDVDINNGSTVNIDSGGSSGDKFYFNNSDASAGATINLTLNGQGANAFASIDLGGNDYTSLIQDAINNSLGSFTAEMITINFA